MSAAPRTVTRVVKLSKKTINSGFSAWRLSADALPKFDPFLACDWFEMSQVGPASHALQLDEPTFPPHPHAGFSAVTMLLAGGNFVNRDSRGDRSIIRPGDVHWTCAGSGIVHEEIPEVPGTMGYGLQIFVNLAPEHKMLDARIDKLHSEDIPVCTTPDGAKVRVIAGETAGGVASPINDNLLTKVTLLDVTLPEGASISHPVPAGHNVVALVLSGRVSFESAGGEGGSVSAESVCEFSDEGSTIEARGLKCDQDEPAHFVLFSGKPIGAPVVWRGPFCGNSDEQVAAFAEAYAAGRMGTLTASPIFSQMGR